MVQHLFRGQYVIGSIPHGGPIELFSCSSQFFTTGVIKAMVCTILFVERCI